MPFYEFECKPCGIQFEKLVRRMGAVDSMPCPECGEASDKQVTAAAFSFAHDPVGGPRPQNTGVHSLDYNADQIIGREAAKHHRLIEERQSRKRQLIRDNPGKSGRDLARSPGGQDYHVMKPEERQAAETARGLHNKAQQLIADDISARSEKRAG